MAKEKNIIAVISFLELSVICLLVLTLMTPLLFNSAFLFPFISTKTFYFRTLVEIALIFYLPLIALSPQHRPVRSPLIWAVAAYGTILAFTSIIGVNPYRSFWGNIERGEGLLTLSHLGAWWIMVISLFRTRRAWIGFLSATAVVGVLESGYALLQRIEVPWPWVIYSGASRISGTIGNPAFLGSYLLLLSLVILLLFFQVKQHALRWLLLILIGFEMALVYQTQTRGTLLGIAIGLLVLAVLFITLNPALVHKRKTVNLRLIAIGLIMFVCAAGTILWASRESDWIENFPALRRIASISPNDITVQSRFYAWDSSWKGWRDRFLLGYGYENYHIAFNKYFHPEIFLDQGSQLWFDRAHNILFDQAVQAGLLGLLSYISIFACSFWLLWRAAAHPLQISAVPQILSHGSRIAPLAIIAGLSAYVTQNLFVFDTLSSYLLLLLVLAYIVRHTATAHPEKNAAPYRMPPVAGACVALIAAVILSFAFYHFNFLPAKANMKAIEALQYSNRATNPLPGENPTLVARSFYSKTFDTFKESLSYGTYQSAEIRQKMSEIAMIAARHAAIPNDLKKEIYQLAIDELQINLDEDPGDVQNLMYMMTVYNASKQYDTSRIQKVIDLGYDAIKLSPQRPQIYFDMGQAAISLQKFDDGIAYFQKALELNPKPYESQWNLGAALILAGNPDKAQMIFDNMINSGFAFYGRDNIVRLDNVYRIAHQYEHALALYERARAENEAEREFFTQKLASVYAEYAAWLKNKGDHQAAAAAVDQAVSLDPQLAGEAESFKKSLNENATTSD